jgi:hypothetical protein
MLETDIGLENSLESDDLLRKSIINDYSERLLNAGLLVESSVLSFFLKKAEAQYIDNRFSKTEENEPFFVIFTKFIETFLLNLDKSPELEKGSEYRKLFSFLIADSENYFQKQKEHQEALDKLESEADIDNLTKIPRRVELQKDFNIFVEGRRSTDKIPFSLIILDID